MYCVLLAGLLSTCKSDFMVTQIDFVFTDKSKSLAVLDLDTPNLFSVVN